jgi:hypothetical protein
MSTASDRPRSTATAQARCGSPGCCNKEDALNGPAAARQGRVGNELQISLSASNPNGNLPTLSLYVASLDGRTKSAHEERTPVGARFQIFSSCRSQSWRKLEKESI